jgi:CubicO group peptidase (beta-lactamase class C family)
MAFQLRRVFETLIRPYPPDEVTTRADETDPMAVGVSREDIETIWRAVIAAYKTQLYPAIGLCIRRKGQVILDRAIGHAQGNAPFEPADAARTLATPKTLFNLFSASKMVTSMLMHLCDQRGLVHLDDPVAHYVPEFGKHGKDRITIRHVLTHRAGIPRIPAEFADVGFLSRGHEILDMLCDAKPDWVPGRRLAYHALTGGFVLAAIIEKATGKDVKTFLEDEILKPLHFDGFNFGVPAARLPEVAIDAFTGPPVVPPASTILRRALSVSVPEAVRISNDPRFLTGCVPSGNTLATPNETSRFMQLLLNGGELDGVRIFEPRTLARAVAEQSYFEVDFTLALPIRYSMGFMLGGPVASIYGLGTTRAFGHLGFTNVFVYAEPERELAVALMTTGKPVLSPGVARLLWVLQVIARRIPKSH